MLAETVASPRGEFVVLTGAGRVRSVQPIGQHGNGLELDLVPDGVADGELGIKVIVDDKTREPFAALFAEGRAAFLLRHRLTTFSFRVEVTRLPVVEKHVPIRNVPKRFRTHRLTVLTPVDHAIQEVVA